MDGQAPCYPAVLQLALIRQWHRDGVNHARAHQLGSRLLAARRSRAPRAVLGERLAPSLGRPPAEPGRATTAPPSSGRQRPRRCPRRPSRTQPTGSLRRESACPAVGHWLPHSLLQLCTTPTHRLSLSLVRRTRRPLCPGCRRVRVVTDRCRHARASIGRRASCWLGWPVCMLARWTVTTGSRVVVDRRVSGRASSSP
jgi:hypothetical protein